ncbi:BET1-like protein [Liparis tanakae]|uniref:BET1-like protein n=1 Tax=Liparis tanakae TaxID=230148 RepID=A0A4Z2FZ96_9TELE|nr:BET1-like protein [Liparis tanakae]
MAPVTKIVTSLVNMEDWNRGHDSVDDMLENKRLAENLPTKVSRLKSLAYDIDRKADDQNEYLGGMASTRTIVSSKAERAQTSKVKSFESPITRPQAAPYPPPSVLPISLSHPAGRSSLIRHGGSMKNEGGWGQALWPAIGQPPLYGGPFDDPFIWPHISSIQH